MSQSQVLFQCGQMLEVIDRMLDESNRLIARANTLDPELDMDELVSTAAAAQVMTASARSIQASVRAIIATIG
jgi:hypothetical protein